MKKLLILFFVSTVAKAQTTTPDSAKYYDGSLKTICGLVADVHVSSSGTIFINFDKSFPLTEFTAVIFAKDTAKFKEYKPATDLPEKNICVTGMIKLYKDKPEIIIKSPNQIRFPDSKE